VKSYDRTKALTRAADEAVFDGPTLQPRAELVEARWEPAAAVRQAQGEVVIALALDRHHESGLRLIEKSRPFGFGEARRPV
jgi:hypothetical protein